MKIPKPTFKPSALNSPGSFGDLEVDTVDCGLTTEEPGHHINSNHGLGGVCSFTSDSGASGLWTPPQARNLIPKTGVLRLHGDNRFTRRRNLCKELPDKASKLVFREIFETG